MPRETDLVRLCEVALHISKGLTQRKVSELLKIPQSEVSRRVNEARERKILTTPRPVFQGDKVPESDLAEARKRVEFSDLVHQLKENYPYLRHVEISAGDKHELEDAYEVTLGPVAAARIIEHARSGRMRRCAVTWGQTILSVLRALNRRNVPEPPGPIEFLPLAGEPTVLVRNKHYSPHETATALATQLWMIFNPKAAREHQDPPVQSLDMVPVRIPGDFLDGFEKARRADVTEILMQFFTHVPAYGNVFKARGLLRQPSDDDHAPDTVITSVAVTSSLNTSETGTSTRVMEDPTLDHEGEGVRMHVSGNLAGVLLPLQEDDKVGKKIIGRINARTMTPSLDSYQELTEKARQSEDSNQDFIPGVIIVASRAVKAHVLHYLLTLNTKKGELRPIGNELIIDHNLAKALLDVTGSKDPSDGQLG